MNYRKLNNGLEKVSFRGFGTIRLPVTEGDNFPTYLQEYKKMIGYSSKDKIIYYDIDQTYG